MPSRRPTDGRPSRDRDPTRTFGRLPPLRIEPRAWHQARTRTRELVTRLYLDTAAVGRRRRSRRTARISFGARIVLAPADGRSGDTKTVRLPAVRLESGVRTSSCHAATTSGPRYSEGGAWVPATNPATTGEQTHRCRVGTTAGNPSRATLAGNIVVNRAARNAADNHPGNPQTTSAQLAGRDSQCEHDHVARFARRASSRIQRATIRATPLTRMSLLAETLGEVTIRSHRLASPLPLLSGKGSGKRSRLHRDTWIDARGSGGGGTW